MALWSSEVSGNKNIRAAISYIYGIGKRFGEKSKARQILEKLKIDPETRVKDLTDQQINLINQATKEFPTEDSLRRNKEQDIRDKMSINCYQGICHSMRKKVRGQSTRHNNRNRPGWPKLYNSHTKERKTIAGKKAPPKQG
jgi:small subunit ribosomal protein S13